jgi:hypothetical protein
MKLKITAWQRFQCIQVVGALRGTVAILHQGGKLLDILQFTDKEKAEIGYLELGGGQAKWRDAERTFDIEIKDGNQGDLLKRSLEQFADWPVANASQSLDLLKQAGVEIAEADAEEIAEPEGED